MAQTVAQAVAQTVADTLSNNFKKLAGKLFADESERELFTAAVAKAESAAPAIIWLERNKSGSPFEALPRAPWQPDFVDALEPDTKAGAHELHEKGNYYCLDLSSVFQAAPLLEIAAREGEIETAIDVCSSPGGKCVLLWRTFKPKVVVANEVIGKRLGGLVSNLNRCKIAADVTNSEVEELAEAWPNAFDLVFVDAPCSGQSLVARGVKAPACFHPATINMNSNRQKRILANSGKLVSPGGYLLYTTCTYSTEENEGVLKWFLKRFEEFQTIEVSSLADYRSKFSDDACYRLFPHQGFGAGGFCALLQRKGEERGDYDPDRVRRVSRTKREQPAES